MIVFFVLLLFQNLSSELTPELSRWKYLTDLSSWLYQVGVVNRVGVVYVHVHSFNNVY